MKQSILFLISLMLNQTMKAQGEMKAETDSLRVIDSPVFIPADSGFIHGSLCVSKHFNKETALLIISGSGPTDRDGNSTMIKGKNDALKQLANTLAQSGFASIRYDKRGIGESKKAGPHEKDLRFDQYVDDAANWVEYLRSALNFKNIIVVGHSEGSLIGMLAAKQSNANGFISLCGAGRKAADIIKEQLSKQLPDSLRIEVNKDLDSLEQGHLVIRYPLPLFSLFRPSVQPYLISWFKEDPAKIIASLQIPMLIVQGKSDIQVSMKDAQVLHEANPKSTLLAIDQMTHVLKIVRDAKDISPTITYEYPDFPLSTKLVEGVLSFLKTFE